VFIIPCKYNSGLTKEDIKNSYVFKSIASIRLHHRNEKILVVDSDSDNTEYLNIIGGLPNVFVADAKNKNYLDGAIWYAFDNFPDEKWYCSLQDTIILKHNLYEFINGEELFYSLMWWPETINPGTVEMQWLDGMFNDYLKYDLPKVQGRVSFVGCWGPCFVGKRETLQIFKDNNLHRCLPVDKFGAQMSERLWSICLGIENINVQDNTIDGDFLAKALPRRHFNEKTKYHNKFYAGRN
tara:strand:- start:973 stop:1689 length:717 start_codon:yes stop_codon:yes gene_type:complete